MAVTEENVRAINFGSIEAAGAGYRALDGPEVKEALRVANDISPTRAYLLARGVLSTVVDRDQYVSEASDMVEWAKLGTADDRVLVTRAIRNDGGRAGEIFLVHQISGMTRAEARPFISDYFDADGDMKAVVEWLAGAGSVLRQHRVKDTESAGAVVDAVEWVVDVLEDAVDAIGEAVTSVVDAVVNAGRQLADFAAEVVTWTVEAVGDLVEALIEAGQSLGDMLAAAVEAGNELVRKFVRAMIVVGLTVDEILVAAVGLAGDRLRMVVDALLVAGQALGDVVAWAAAQSLGEAQLVVEALFDLGRTAVQIIKPVQEMGAAIMRAVVEAVVATGQALGDLLISAMTESTSFFDALVEVGRDIVASIGELFDAIGDSIADGITRLAASLVRIGHSLLNLAEWAVEQVSSILTDVVRGIFAAGTLLIDFLAVISVGTVSFMAEIVKAIVDIGRTVYELTRYAIELGQPILRKFLEALGTLADGFRRFAAEVAMLTYDAAERFIGSMIDLGLSFAEILATTVEGTYWMFRRVVSAIVQRSDGFAGLLDWIATRATPVLAELWEDALQAARYAGREITEAIAWALDHGSYAVEAILNAWESMGDRLEDFYSEALRLAQLVGHEIFEFVGYATVRLENSVLYVLKYLERDALPALASFVKGVLDASYELTELVIHLVSLTAQAQIEVLRVLLSLGQTFADLLAATMRDPKQSLVNLLTAANEAYLSLSEIYHATLVETLGLYEAAVTKAARELGRSIQEILDAVVEVAGGAIGTVIGTLLNLLPSYRPMNDDEIETAQLVFGDSLDYSRIYFSQESWPNETLFELQKWILSSDDSTRPFTTNTVVNFDVSGSAAGELDRPTIIHELGHVWQFEETGPFYIPEAIHAQEFGDGYDYGYADPITGSGAEDDLRAVFIDNPGISVAHAFELFNREQQAQILQHFYVRRQEELDVEPWLPFQQLVYS